MTFQIETLLQKLFGDIGIFNVNTIFLPKETSITKNRNHNPYEWPLTFSDNVSDILLKLSIPGTKAPK